MKNSDILINYRAKNNLTQADLANKMGISKLTVNLIENNKYKVSRLLQAKINIVKEET